MSDIYTTVFNHDLAMGTVFKTALIEIEDRLLTLDAFRARITALEIALREAREVFQKLMDLNAIQTAGLTWHVSKAIVKIDEALK